MNGSYSSSAIVTLTRLRPPKDMEVTVEILVHLGTDPTEPHFQFTKPPLLQAEERDTQRHKSVEDLLLGSSIAIICGVEHFRTQYPEIFDYRITLLEGRDLSDDCTVGFFLAGFMAAARALGSALPAGEEAYGWIDEETR